ncbi:tRNA1(Val) (adenine(37)-N6)-methyltransferase [Pseudogracilibacillus auburnensis]|uniref:tRNA1(Val) A37 N6-methylase TrmN6 n=1 Tax=Pseudogracilibacillus auburnensis TaxID=1494959 RepID=A0A2V3VIA5_9BACI|nr:tRNA1(Val) (adenine(37)-N6)-methyltransferase [Pseudogracilibacillus auburnensis]MBO1004472.1 tRNA1(Val) (adenine(37)-N6)-methyltransferase [Pseudogracilibacillus auburnensis]PXW81533.1 tRNA1(Val) A37 N6-methylase TrmN6 [Pseudogracilibacillus auburnensis]
MKLYDDERIDYLISNEKIQIIQSPTIFSYSLDAVLLAYFTYVPINKGNILDLCTGNGVIPFLLSQKTKGQIVGLEIQSRLVNMARRSVLLNDLQERINIVEGDLKEEQPNLKQSNYEVVTCNPPYFTTPQKTEHNQNEFLTIARHEVCCTLEDVVKACKLYVKPGGKVSIVHRPERLVDMITLFRKYRIEPKRVQFVYSKMANEANTLLIEGIRDGKPGLKILPPLYIYNDDGTYTKKAREIIYGK